MRERYLGSGSAGCPTYPEPPALSTLNASFLFFNAKLMEVNEPLMASRGM
jgi:hypothetical protein